MTSRLIQMSGVVVDLVYQVADIPLAGNEAEVRGATLATGGGFNAMVAARRAGLQVLFAGTIGAGPMADMVAKSLKSEGISHVGASLDDADQGICTVLVDDSGERTFIGCPGADGVVYDADVANLCPDTEDWILLSGYALSYSNSSEALTRWLQSCSKGTRLVFDPGPRVATIAPETLRIALEAALWVSANAAEALAITGKSDPSEAACVLSAACPVNGGAIVRIGAQGAWLSQGGQPACHIPGHAVHAIDTNGAGDAHIGYFISMLAAGLAPTQALRAANVAAALSTTQEGPSTAPLLNLVNAVLASTSEL